MENSSMKSLSSMITQIKSTLKWNKCFLNTATSTTAYCVTRCEGVKSPFEKFF